jgi:NitT/TauT family transport system substrate-binding protein
MKLDMTLARRLAAIAVASALVLPIPAASTPAVAAPLTPVTIATLPLEPAALAFYAHHRGYFRQQGLDAKLLVLSEPAQLVAALLSGDATVSGFNVGGAAILKSRDAPVHVVAAGAVYTRAAPNTAVVAARGEAIARARDLIGKRIGIDAANTIAHVGLLKWLKGNGVSASEVRFVELPFPQMLGPLGRGTIDAAILPEPYVTLALRRGAKRVANVLHATCAVDCLLTVWMTRRDADPLLAARFRNAIQAAAVWANQPRNDRASGRILGRYAPIDDALLAKMTRSRFAQRLRPAMAQPWIDAFAEFGAIPASFRAIDLVK